MPARTWCGMISESPRLLELELIEPYLFFGLAPHTAERLAEAIANRVLRLRTQTECR